MGKSLQSEFHKIDVRILHLLHTQKWSDCSFLIVDSDSDDKQKIQGHKIILAVASPVFEAMFFGKLPENDEIVIEDIKPDTFQAMLQYIYSGAVTIRSIHAACNLHYASIKYMLTHLAEQCVQFLIQGVNVENASTIYEFGKFVEDRRITDCSMEVIRKNTSAVLNFTNINISTFNDILDKENLAIKSELELFSALERIAENNGITSADIKEAVSFEIDSTTNESVEKSCETEVLEAIKLKLQSSRKLPKSDAVAIRCAVKKIRFLTMQQKEFAKSVGATKLLMQSEAYTLLICLLCREVSSPLKDFTMSTKQRCKLSSKHKHRNVRNRIGRNDYYDNYDSYEEHN